MVAGRLEVVSVILWYDRGMMRTLMGAPLKAAPMPGFTDQGDACKQGKMYAKTGVQVEGRF